MNYLQQWVTGSLRAKRGKRYYNSINVEDIEYWDQPHEIEAREQEVKLYREYLTEMRGMPDHEVAHWFPNRLLRML